MSQNLVPVAIQIQKTEGPLVYFIIFVHRTLTTISINVRYSSLTLWGMIFFPFNPSMH